VIGSAGIRVYTDNLTTVVDAVGIAGRCTRRVECTEAAAAQQAALGIIFSTAALVILSAEAFCRLARAPEPSITGRSPQSYATLPNSVALPARGKRYCASPHFPKAAPIISTIGHER
jgi:hypothetical protein